MTKPWHLKYLYLLSVTHPLTCQVHILSGTTSINISTQNTVHSVTASKTRGKIKRVRWQRKAERHSSLQETWFKWKVDKNHWAGWRAESSQFIWTFSGKKKLFPCHPFYKRKIWQHITADRGLCCNDPCISCQIIRTWKVTLIGGGVEGWKRSLDEKNVKRVYVLVYYSLIHISMYNINYVQV